MRTENKPKGERLQVVLARFGLASRRGVVSLIEEGKVVVNSEVVREKGFRVNTTADKIIVNGEEISLSLPVEKRYFMLNKPKGVMTTMQDPHAERVVADFFRDVSARLFPVGRLDRDTTGLLLMTNDGELAFRLMHPKFGIAKRYKARVEGLMTEEKIKYLEKGILLEEGKTSPCKIEIETTFASGKKEPPQTILTVTLHEGKKRQIRRIFERVGHRVLELDRLNYGPLALGDLKRGDKRELTAAELKQLKQAVLVHS